MTLEQELKLIEEAKHDRAAFVQLYRAYVERVYKYCYLRLPSREIAEDITSDVFMKLVEKIQDLDTARGHRLSAWLFRVAHNAIVDYYRKTKADQLDWHLENDLPSETEHSEEFIKQHTRKQQISVVMNSIHKRYQQILSLKFFGELETEEIALHLDIKPKQVYVLLHRALGAFEKEFGENFEKSEIFI